MTHITNQPGEKSHGVTVLEHEHFLKSIIPNDNGLDKIDRELDEHIEIDNLVSGTNNRRSDRELSRMLELIDNLPISDNGKDGSH